MRSIGVQDIDWFYHQKAYRKELWPLEICKRGCSERRHSGRATTSAHSSHSNPQPRAPVTSCWSPSNATFILPTPVSLPATSSLGRSSFWAWTALTPGHVEKCSCNNHLLILLDSLRNLPHTMQTASIWRHTFLAALYFIHMKMTSGTKKKKKKIFTGRFYNVWPKMQAVCSWQKIQTNIWL